MESQRVTWSQVMSQSQPSTSGLHAGWRQTPTTAAANETRSQHPPAFCQFLSQQKRENPIETRFFTANQTAGNDCFFIAQTQSETEQQHSQQALVSQPSLTQAPSSSTRKPPVAPLRPSFCCLAPMSLESYLQLSSSLTGGKSTTGKVLTSTDIDERKFNRGDLKRVSLNCELYHEHCS